MAMSPVELCSAALVKLGARGIEDFGDGRVEATVAATLYPLIRDSLLTAYPWGFTLKRSVLDQPETLTVGSYRRRFSLPDDFLRAIALEDAGGVGYEIVGGALQSNALTPTLAYQFRADESAFPVYFQTALVARLAAEFCLPITENTSRAETLRQIAEAEFARARQAERLQDTPATLQDWGLIDARFS
ncbi:MAG: hypothetical protein ACFB6S_06570 [Geminicoccaceae bacterium]